MSQPTNAEIETPDEPERIARTCPVCEGDYYEISVLNAQGSDFVVYHHVDGSPDCRQELSTGGPA